MLKLLTLVGARPQIIKASAISRVIRSQYASSIREVIVHTGQHYDPQLSAVFFDELAIPQPDYNLRVGSGKHGDQTARMIHGLEEVLEIEKPDYLILYGDTNSTLAGAIAASKLHIPIVHVEAGLRSFNKRMPEEINRILADHVSTYLFPPTQAGVENLRREGFRTDTLPPYTPDNPGIFNVGDVMYDNTLYFAQVAARQPDHMLCRLNLDQNKYVLATLHRNANTDDPVRLNAIFGTLHELAQAYAMPIVMPLHPRTLKQMQVSLAPALLEAIRANPWMRLLGPVSFLEITQLEQHARLVITDSGGVQKEAFFFGRPSLILRAETEWVEIVESGLARLCDARPDEIRRGFEAYLTMPMVQPSLPYGSGKAADTILSVILENHPPLDRVSAVRPDSVRPNLFDGKPKRALQKMENIYTTDK